MLTASVLIFVFAGLFVSKASSGLPSVREYAHKLVLKRWHSEAEWRALDAIIRPESGWNPCASYPSRHDCSYSGSASCGVPQANPCPSSWRGRLWETRHAQVRWLMDYVFRRYKRPSLALAFRQAHGYY